MTGIAFFDEYPGPILGHHPDLIVGLGRAAAEMMPVRLYCPLYYLSATDPPPAVKVVSVNGCRLPVDVDVTRDNLLSASHDARNAGITTMVNLFFDESHPGVPLDDIGVRFVHVVHRPGELPRDRSTKRRLAAVAERDAFVVHTVRGREVLDEVVPGASVTYVPWPAATAAAIDSRFNRMPAVVEPRRVAVVGGARRDKGTWVLLEAMVGGPPVHIIGELAPEDEQQVREWARGSDVVWADRWVDPHAMEEAIAAAAVLVFPYLPEFTRHAGASGSLAQARTFAKPIVVSDVLAPELVSTAGCLKVPAGDVHALRRVVEQALANDFELHNEARSAREEVRRAHSYEYHVQALLVAASS